jgi:hypothetical protein
MDEGNKELLEGPGILAPTDNHTSQSGLLWSLSLSDLTPIYQAILLSLT